MIQQESQLGGTENESEWKLESTSLSHKQPPQYQQVDSLRGNNYQSAGVPADSSTTHPAGAKHTGSTHSHSKRGSTKGEVCFLFVTNSSSILSFKSLKFT